MRAGDTRPAACGQKQASPHKEVATGSLQSSSNISVFPLVVRSLESLFPSAPRLGGALGRLYRVVLAVAGGAFLFLCLSVRFMAFDDDDSPRSTSTWNQTLGRRKADTHLPYPAEPDVTAEKAQEPRCASAELRPCSLRDMTFRVHHSQQRRGAQGGGGSCVQLPPEANRCLAGPNRFRTMRECEAACSRHSTPSPSKETSAGTTHSGSRRCNVGPSFRPCALGHRRSSNFVFEDGRCVSLHGSCTDGGFSTLRECRLACLDERRW
ncbi:uncharacterized protein LOC144133588 isoform X2 [Amblyomma americanum]